MVSASDILRDSTVGDDDARGDLIQDALHSIRTHLGMDVAFLAEFQQGDRIFRNIDSDLDLPIKPGDATPLEETYCQRVVDGRLPGLIPDTSLIPEAADLPVTKEFGLGAYLTSPIVLANGDLYGTLCCLSFTADPSLGSRDMAMLNLFGDFVGRQLERTVAVRKSHDDIAIPIQQMLETRGFFSVYQPIYDLGNDVIVGLEALTRFSALPARSPDAWFKDAASVGLSEDLEMAAIDEALKGLSQFPADIYLSLNVSPCHILNGSVARALSGEPLDRIVLEITEHDSVADYEALALALVPLRKQGLRVAVDDAGAGYASFRHILSLAPDIIKLDISIIRDIDTNTARRALAAAIITFAEETSCKVVAEGVETEAELATLRVLRVSNVQGYLLGRPATIEATLGLLQAVS